MSISKKMSATSPLLLRIGSDRTDDGQCDLTAVEPLPSPVEVTDGMFLHSGTRVTEVKTETTDDN